MVLLSTSRSAGDIYTESSEEVQGLLIQQDGHYLPVKNEKSSAIPSSSELKFQLMPLGDPEQEKSPVYPERGPLNENIICIPPRETFSYCKSCPILSA